jgi:hypothetical protein
VKVHIKAIAERYIIDGETADGALMFLPSEAVYAELHAQACPRSCARASTRGSGSCRPRPAWRR